MLSKKNKWIEDIVTRAAWTFLQTFVVVFGAGLINVLNAFQSGGLDAAQSAGLALLLASLAAGFSAVKTTIKAVK